MTDPRPSRFRFRLSTLLLVMSVASVMAAAASYAVQGWRGERSGLVVFVLFTVLAPLLVVIVASQIHRLFHR